MPRFGIRIKEIVMVYVHTDMSFAALLSYEGVILLELVNPCKF